MSNISQYSQTAASNNSASPNGFPEGMAPSGLNDSAREVMAALAKWYAGLDGTLTTTGSSNAYVLSTGSSHAALADIGLVVFKANFANTGAATLAVDGLTAKAIEHRSAALVSGMILADTIYAVVYNSTSDAFDLIASPAAFNALIASSLVAAGLTYPSSDGSSGQYLTTNGSGTLSFANAAQNITRSARTSNTILAAGDKATLVDVTSGTFSQTLTAAATLGDGWFCYLRNSGTGVVTIDPNSSETFNGSTTFALYQGNTALIMCDGSNFYGAVMADSAGDHQVIVTTGNGFGSTNTNIRRFTTTQESTGSAITYADSAGNGATFTINQSGIYSIRYLDVTSSASSTFGISLNSSELTTSILSITAADRLAVALAGTGIYTPCTWTGRLAAGDVIRAHAAVSGITYTSSAVENVFQITKIGH